MTGAGKEGSWRSRLRRKETGYENGKSVVRYPPPAMFGEPTWFMHEVAGAVKRGGLR